MSPPWWLRQTDTWGNSVSSPIPYCTFLAQVKTIPMLKKNSVSRLHFKRIWLANGKTETRSATGIRAEIPLMTTIIKSTMLTIVSGQMVLKSK